MRKYRLGQDLTTLIFWRYRGSKWSVEKGVVGDGEASVLRKLVEARFSEVADAGACPHLNHQAILAKRGTIDVVCKHFTVYKVLIFILLISLFRIMGCQQFGSHARRWPIQL